MIQITLGCRRFTVRAWRAAIQTVAALTLCVCAAAVHALPTFPPIVSSTYTLKAGGTIATSAAACGLCHASAGPPDLNVYGKDVQLALKAAHARAVTATILHSIDDKDSDGDGWSNGAEYAADTLPGDPKSHPTGTPPVAKPASSGTTSFSSSAGGSAPQSGSEGGLRALLLPKHAQHPVIVHLPIGLFMGGLFFDLLSLRKKHSGLAYAGFVNLALAAVTAVGSVASGLLAWQWAYGGAALKGPLFTSEGTLLTHLLLGIVSTLLFWALLAMRLRNKDRGAVVGTGYLVLALVAAAVLAVTGHLGGNLSGVN